ncbi:MAG: DNA internalization-related competence protein ComEC/Rec2, partial [Lachnospiraceae bacterium]|nr:DNA internalization-related competence protein ComEC/Rec2 [Lachnospiraceae bacterium]
GDIGERAEQYIAKYLREADKTYEVLKVAHHGSKNSSSEEFLEAVSPQIAVISCGMNNRYGHPHENVIERLDKHGYEIMRTDLHGAVIIEFGKELRVYGYAE